MTRNCAQAIEESEYSVLNLIEVTNPTLVTYSQLIHYVLSHVQDVVYNCSSSIINELSKNETYVAMGNAEEVMETIDYWL